MSHHRIAPNVDDQSDQLAEALAPCGPSWSSRARSREDVLGKQQGRPWQTLELPDLDLHDIDFVTIDPASSTDLDQALFIDRSGDGLQGPLCHRRCAVLRGPGGALDAETRRRGQTFYAPDGRIPLHPEVISENAGSLLAGQALRRFRLGIRPGCRRRGAVRAGAPRRGPQPGQAELQGRPGRARRRHRPARSAAPQGSGTQARRAGTAARRRQPQHAGTGNSTAPDGGGYRIVAAPSLPVEDWNAQISLMTGMAAAQMMLDGKVGILRTMPAPDERSLLHFKRQTPALGQALGRRSELRRIPADLGRHRSQAAGHPALGRNVVPRRRLHPL